MVPSGLAAFPAPGYFGSALNRLFGLCGCRASGIGTELTGWWSARPFVETGIGIAGLPLRLSFRSVTGLSFPAKCSGGGVACVLVNAVVEPGTPLVDDPERIGAVRHFGVDETSFLAANQGTPPSWSTLRPKWSSTWSRGRAADLRKSTAKADPTWLGDIEVVATDPAEPFRGGLSPHLDQARWVADPFHVVRADKTLPGQGAPTSAEQDPQPSWTKVDPLYRIRKLLDRLRARAARVASAASASGSW